nr:putative methyltransferase [Erysiphe necator associated abispo virus 1]
MADIRFDDQPDWQALDQEFPGYGDGNFTPSRSSHSSGSSVSSRPPSPAPSSVPGDNLPYNRRKGEPEVVLQHEDGQVAKVSRRGNLKNFGAPFDKPGAFRKVQRVPFALTDRELKYMQKNFPNTFFAVTKDQNHDHPIAHLETMIGTRHMIDTIRDGARILDVFGNPGARDSFMGRRDLRGRTMETLVSLSSEKDYLRRNTKWGNAIDANGNVRYHEMRLEDALAEENREWIQGFDVFMFIHTAYYVDMARMVDLLSRNPRSIAKLLIHRHKHEQGRLFDGEVEYTSRRGFIVQRNVKTGERYTHQTLEWLFTSATKVWRSERGAITWTFKRVTDETWMVDMAWCPNDLDERFHSYANQQGQRVAAHRMNEESMLDTSPIELPQLPSGEIITFGGIVCVRPTGFARSLRLTNMDYYNYLCSAMVGKGRDENDLKDLFALARRENSLTSQFPGAKRFEVPVEDVADHVTAAFLAGVPREIELHSMLHQAQAMLSKHSKLAKGEVANFTTTGTTFKAGLRVAKELNEVRRSKDTLTALLEAVDKRT